MRRILAIFLLSCFLLAGVASAEYFNFSPDMTSNSLPAGNTTTAISEYSAAHPAWHGMDMDTSSFWASVNSGSNLGPWWWVWKAPYSKVMTNYTVYGRSDDVSTNMRNWTLRGSNDGVTWTTLDTQTEQVWVSLSTPKSYPISNTQPYSYYNFSITRCSFAGTNNCGFGDVVFYENTTPINSSFIQSPNLSIIGQPVTFTDVSSGLPVTWSWSVTGGSPTNTTQGATYIYTTSGTYNIFLNITNATGSWSNSSQTHTVIGRSGAAFYMPANGTTSDVFPDLSLSPATLTNNGNPRYKNSNSSWRFNNAVFLTGTSSLTSNNRAYNMSNDNVAVGFWYNGTSASGNYNQLVGGNQTSTADGGWRIGSRVAGANNCGIALYFAGTSDYACSPSKNINDGVWHYILMNRNGAYLSLAVDGVEYINQSITTRQIGRTTNGLSIGYNGVDNVYAAGYIDDLVIYNGTIPITPLPTSEWGSTAINSTTRLYLPFNGTSLAQIVDLSE
jgi:hypothetical protein